MLSKRNRVQLRRFGMNFMPKAHRFHCRSGECIDLANLSAGTEALITCNNDLRMIERGLYRGRKVTAFRNDPGEPNIVVAAGDARYVIDRRVAKLIRVRVV